MSSVLCRRYGRSGTATSWSKSPIYAARGITYFDLTGRMVHALNFALSHLFTSFQNVLFKESATPISPKQKVAPEDLSLLHVASNCESESAISLS
eukprot:6062477-Pleurochrysis_carterae.AAC.1